MCGLLVLYAASRRSFIYGECHAYCDNKGVVGHVAKPNVPLAHKQIQADVFLAINKMIRDLPVTVNYEHVFGHLDDILEWDELTDIQQLNVRMDTRAKEALMNSIISRECISSVIAFEQVTSNESYIQVVGI